MFRPPFSRIVLTLGRFILLPLAANAQGWPPHDPRAMVRLAALILMILASTAALGQEPIFAKVLSCYDGDTCRLEREVLPGGDQFHLANADTPEIEGQGAAEKQRAIEAASPAAMRADPRSRPPTETYASRRFRYLSGRTAGRLTTRPTTIGGHRGMSNLARRLARIESTSHGSAGYRSVK